MKKLDHTAVIADIELRLAEFEKLTIEKKPVSKEAYEDLKSTLLEYYATNEKYITEANQEPKITDISADSKPEKKKASKGFLNTISEFFSDDPKVINAKTKKK